MSAKCRIVGAWSDEPTQMKRFADSSEFLDAGGKCRDCYKSGQNVSWKSHLLIC